MVWAVRWWWWQCWIFRFCGTSGSLVGRSGLLSVHSSTGSFGSTTKIEWRPWELQSAPLVVICGVIWVVPWWWWQCRIFGSVALPAVWWAAAACSRSARVRPASAVLLGSDSDRRSCNRRRWWSSAAWSGPCRRGGGGCHRGGGVVSFGGLIGSRRHKAARWCR